MNLLAVLEKFVFRWKTIQAKLHATNSTNGFIKALKSNERFKREA